MAQIFLSYRRSDSEYASGRISDRLRHALGDEAVFRDVDAIELGADYEKRVKNILDNVAVMLVIIGDEWLSVTDDDGKRRLDNPDDLVRREVVGALSNEDVRVVPVLISNTTMPTADELPDDLKPLATRNAATVRADADFDDQMDKLIRIILERAPELRPSRRYGKLAGIGVAATALVGVVWWLTSMVTPPPAIDMIELDERDLSVEFVPLGETRYQAVYLRSGGQGSSALGGAVLRKYTLDIDVRDAQSNRPSEILKATQVFADELDPDAVGYGARAIFLALTAGDESGTALVTVSYQASPDAERVTSETLEVPVLASDSDRLDALQAMIDIENQLRDSSISDAEILQTATDLLNGRNGTDLSGVFDDAQRARLEEIEQGISGAMATFEAAVDNDPAQVTLDARQTAWREYIKQAGMLSRQNTETLDRAVAEIAAIDEFRNGTMHSAGYKACRDVQNRNCVGESRCFAGNSSPLSWSQMAAFVAGVTIDHELLRKSDGEIVDRGSSEITSRNPDPGFRTWKKLDPDGAGEYQLRVRYGDVLVDAVDIQVGDCD